jgi:hypothetical protein
VAPDYRSLPFSTTAHSINPLHFTIYPYAATNRCVCAVSYLPFNMCVEQCVAALLAGPT